MHALARITADRHEVLVLTSNRDLGEATRLDVPSDQWLHRDAVEVYYASADRAGRYWSALRELRRRRPDIIYLNSYFSPRFSLLPRLLHRLHWWGAAALILAPRGELSAGALGIKSAKKRALMAVARLIGLDDATVWHASSEREAADIQGTIPGAPAVLVRPNETDLPPKAAPPRDTARTIPRFVFVSRLVPMKGLDVALRALAKVSEALELDVFGAEEDLQHVTLCRRLAQQLPAHVRVTFRGPLAPEAVRSTIGAYDALVLPTRGENFGHVIAEALSASCPVLTSDATPWTDVLAGGGGVVVSPSTVECWTRAVDDYARRVRAESRSLRSAASVAYESWRARQDGPTIFDLYDDHRRLAGGQDLAGTESARQHGTEGE